MLLPVERALLPSPILSTYVLKSLELSKQLAELSIAALDGTVNLSLGTVSAIASVLEDFVSPNGAASASQGMVAALLAFLHLVRRETLLHPEVRQVGILQLLRGLVGWMVIQGMTRSMWTANLRGVRTIDVAREKRLSLQRRHRRFASSGGGEPLAGGSGSIPRSDGFGGRHSRHPSAGSSWSQWSRATNYTVTTLNRGNSFRASAAFDSPVPDSAYPDDESDIGPSISARGDSPNLGASDSEVEDLPPFSINGVDYPTWSSSGTRDRDPKFDSIQRDYGFLPPAAVSPEPPTPTNTLDIDDLLDRLSQLDQPWIAEQPEHEDVVIPETAGDELEVVLTQREQQGEMDLVEGFIPGPAIEVYSAMDIDEPEPTYEELKQENEQRKADNRKSMLSMRSNVSFISDGSAPLRESDGLPGSAATYLPEDGGERASAGGNGTPPVMFTDDPIDLLINHLGGPLDLRRIRRYAAVSTGAYGAGLGFLRVLYDRTFGASAPQPEKQKNKATNLDPPVRRLSTLLEPDPRKSPSRRSGTTTPTPEAHPAEHHVLASHAGTRLSAIIHSSFMDDQAKGLGDVLGAIFEPEKDMPAGVKPVGPMRSSHSEPGEKQGTPVVAPEEEHPVPPLPSESWNHPTFYIIADRPAKAIVVVLRGTASISEVMVDMTCEYEEMALDPSWTAADAELFGRDSEREGFKVHGGILRAAHHLAGRGSRFLKHLANALEENPGYGLTLVGHSLGAGLASLLGCMWVERGKWLTRRGVGLPEGRRVKVFAYGGFPRWDRPLPTAPFLYLPLITGNPAVMDIRLSLLSRPLITSIIAGFDVFPRLCVGSVLDLRDIVLAMCSSTGSAHAVFVEVTERAFNYMRRATAAANAGPGNPRPADECVSREAERSPTESTMDTDSGTATPTSPGPRERRSSSVDSIDPDLAWFLSLRKTLSAAVEGRVDGKINDKLFPAGRLLWFFPEERVRGAGEEATGAGSQPRFKVSEIVDPREVLGKIEFSEGLFIDHNPIHYQHVVRSL